MTKILTCYAGTQNSTNLIQLAPQPAIPHFVGCGVWVDTNQMKIIGTPQPAFRTLWDSGWLKLTHIKTLPHPTFVGCRMRVWKMKYQMKGLPQSAGCGMLKQSKQKLIILHSKQINQTSIFGNWVS